MNCIRNIGAIAVALALTPAAWSAGNKALSDAQRQFQQERAYCTSGQSQQDRATCLKEATNAYGEARRGAQGRTRDQLYEEARRKGVRGRSTMTKAELERAVDR